MRDDLAIVRKCLNRAAPWSDHDVWEEAQAALVRLDRLAGAPFGPAGPVTPDLATWGPFVAPDPVPGAALPGQYRARVTGHTTAEALEAALQTIERLQEEARAGEAFYKLTVRQRDAAWREVERMREHPDIQALRQSHDAYVSKTRRLEDEVSALRFRCQQWEAAAQWNAPEIVQALGEARAENMRLRAQAAVAGLVKESWAAAVGLPATATIPELEAATGPEMAERQREPVPAPVEAAPAGGDPPEGETPGKSLTDDDIPF